MERRRHRGLAQRHATGPALSEKSPDDRFQSARDLALLLRDDSTDASVAAPMPASQRRWTVPVILLVVGALAGGAAVWSRLARRQEPLRTTPLAFEIAVPENDRWATGGHVAISNDAVAIAMVVRHEGTQRIGVRRLDDVALQVLSGTEGANQPFFSPDGREVAFFADQQLKAVAIGGGPPRIIPGARTARWHLGRRWRDRVRRIRDVRAEPRAGLGRNAVHDARDRRGQSSVSARAAGQSRRAVHRATRARGPALPCKASEHRRTPLWSMGRRPQFARDSLFYDHGEWTRAAFDARSLRLTGAPVVQPERGTPGSYLGDSSFAMARDGTLVYLPWEPVQRTLVIAGRGGKVDPIPSAPRSYGPPVVSPDGTRFCVAIVASSTSTDLSVGDLNGGLRPFTHDGASRWATWSPAGDRLLFTSRGSGTPDLFSARSDGAEAPLKEYQGVVEAIPISWSADGTWLLDSLGSRPGFESIVAMKHGDKTAMLVPLAVTKTAYGRLSPDGHWLTRERIGPVGSVPHGLSSRRPDVAGLGCRPGQEPIWAKSGKELFFTRANRTLASVAVGGSGAARISPGRLISAD